MWNRLRNTLRKMERPAGALALILGLTGTGVSIYTQVHESSYVTCQSGINQEFLAVLKQRAAVSTDSTSTINNLIIGVFSSKTPAEAQAEYKKYLTELAKVDGELRKLTYPDLGSC